MNKVKNWWIFFFYKRCSQDDLCGRPMRRGAGCSVKTHVRSKFPDVSEPKLKL